MNYIKPEIKTLVENYVAKKQRENYYAFFCANADGEYGDVVYYLNPLTDEDVAALKGLEVKYGEEMVDHLDEYFKDEDELSDLIGGEGLLSIDFTPRHKYRFSIVRVEGDKVVRNSCSIELTDEQYVSLVSYIIELKNFNINALLYHDKELYELVVKALDCEYNLDGVFLSKYPYTYSMDEVNEDAEQIMRENDMSYGPAFPCFLNMLG